MNLSKILAALSRKRRSAIAAIIAAFGSLALALGSPSGGAASGGSHYVALGDSYSSGTGTPHAKGKCLRSDQAYPALYAKRHPKWSFTNATCSGADSVDIRRKQLGDVGPDTKVITLTAGGNDGHVFTGVLLGCVVTEVAQTCNEAITQAGVYVDEQLPGALRRMYGEIQDRAPDAKVITLGYPRMFDSMIGGNPVCDSAPTTATQRKLDAFSDHLNAVVKREADKAGARFVPVSFAGHGVCAEEPWMHGLVLGSGVKNSFHPNAFGHRDGYYSALLQ